MQSTGQLSSQQGLRHKNTEIFSGISTGSLIDAAFGRMARAGDKLGMRPLKTPPEVGSVASSSWLRFLPANLALIAHA